MSTSDIVVAWLRCDFMAKSTRKYNVDLREPVTSHKGVKMGICAFYEIFLPMFILWSTAKYETRKYDIVVHKHELKLSKSILQEYGIHEIYAIRIIRCMHSPT